MKVTLESTETLVVVDGVRVRVWTGQTESGIPMHALVARVFLSDEYADRASEFERELVQHGPPTVDWLATLALRLGDPMRVVDGDAVGDGGDEDDGPEDYDAED